MNAATLSPSEARLAQVLEAADMLSLETRRALLLQIVQLFLDQPRHSETEAALYTACIKRLARGLDSAGRATLAATFADYPDVPASLLGLVAGMHDEYEIVGLLRRGEIEDFIAAFSRAANLSPDESRNALSDPSGHKLADACGLAQFSRTAYSAIVVLSDPLNMRSGSAVENLLALYDGATIQAQAA